MRRVRVTAGLVVLLAAETAVAFGVPAVARWEGRVPAWLPGALSGPTGMGLAREMTDLGDPTRFALLSSAAIGAAWWRLGLGGALRTASFVVAAALTTQGLQELLTRPRDLGFGPRVLAYPSGHMTGATAVALAAAGVLGARPAGTVALVALVDVAMAAALLATGTHVPTDLAAGVLVSAGWGVALGVVDQRGSRSSREARKPSRARVARNHHRER